MADTPLMVIPFSVRKGGYSIMIVLQDGNLERIREYDPAVVQMADLPRNRQPLLDVIVTYGSPADVAFVNRAVREGRMPEALRRLTMGYRYRPDLGDDAAPEVVASSADDRTAVLEAEITAWSIRAQRAETERDGLREALADVTRVSEAFIDTGDREVERLRAAIERAIPELKRSEHSAAMVARDLQKAIERREARNSPSAVPTCYRCEEEIADTDRRGVPITNGLTGAPLDSHWECSMRGVIGSLAHIEKRCSCFVPGAVEGDPEGMTRREAAKAAVDAWLALEKG